MTVIEITDEFYSCDTTIELNPGDTLRGTGSKHCRIMSSNATIIRVNSSNSDWSHTVLIENIVISGTYNPGTQDFNEQVAILLNDAYGCQIRNVSIGNCGTGIKLSSSNSSMNANNMEHVRMEKVNRGIHFSNESGAVDFSYTCITDTGIKTTNYADAIGIIVDAGCKLQNSFMKANVWLDHDDNIGMDVYGELKYNLFHLTVERVERPGGGEAGTGILLRPGAVIATAEEDYNQQIFLADVGLEYAVNNAGGIPSYIVWEQP